MERIDNARKEKFEDIAARWKPIIGRNVGVGCMNKSSLRSVVDANVLGMESSVSTHATTVLFSDLTEQAKKH